MSNMSIDDYMNHFDVICKSIEWNREQTNQLKLFNRRKNRDLVDLVKKLEEYNKHHSSNRIEIKYKNGNIIGIGVI